MEYVNTDYELIYTNYELGIDCFWNLIINVIRLCLIMLVLVRIWTIDNCILFNVAKLIYPKIINSVYKQYIYNPVWQEIV